MKLSTEVQKLASRINRGVPDWSKASWKVLRFALDENKSADNFFLVVEVYAYAKMANTSILVEVYAIYFPFTSI